MQKKIYILLTNVGSPDAPDRRSVAKYLREFLGDSRVITLPFIARKILVNGIIAPFRSPHSAKKYKEIWTPEGSPLIVYAERFARKLQKYVGNEYVVKSLMRYGNPALQKFLNSKEIDDCKELIVVPMFPHYASSTSGTILQLVHESLAKKMFVPKIRTVGEFYSESFYLESICEQIKQHKPENYDLVIFSFHGLPESHAFAAHNYESCEKFSCKKEINALNFQCYRAKVYESVRLISQKLQFSETHYKIAFQSRLSKKWLSPFTDQEIRNAFESGKKKILIAALSFTVDCLETTHEIGVEYAEIARYYPGAECTIVPSLNDSDHWVSSFGNYIIN